MIGWEEAAQSKIKPNTVIQFWKKESYAKASVAQGAKIIMSPAKRTYVDMKYDTTTKLGQAWAAYIEVDSAYNWDPATYVDGIGKEKILGIESPLWTETITTMDEIEYMAFPRMVGYSEIGWSQTGGRSWDEYKVRLGKHAGRLKALNIDYYRSALVPWVDSLR
jgi:hexosaminidase